MPGNSASRWWAITSSSGTSSVGSGRRLLERHEARQDLGRDLHAREHRLVGDGVAHEHGEAERQVGDVGERPARGDRERRQRREDRLLEVPRELRALLLVELVARRRRGCRARPAPGAAVLRSSRSAAGPARARARGSARSSRRGCARPGSGSRRPRRSGRAGRRRAPCRTRRGSSCRSRRTSPARAAARARPRRAAARAR